MTREEAVVVLEALMKNPLFSEVHKVAFNIAIHDIKAYHKWNLNELVLTQKDNEQEPILDKIRADITKFADTIPFVSGDIKAKYTNIGQHDGLEQALEIIEGNLKGDFDIDEWMAENE